MFIRRKEGGYACIICKTGNAAWVMNNYKLVLSKTIAVTLAASYCMPVYAGTWSNPSADTWQYKDDNGNLVKGSWIADTDGKRYYLDENGNLVSGWRNISDGTYFFNPLHDGSFGALMTGWQWIDGHCYYFGSDGKLVKGGTTPDGYMVDASGKWVENGSVVSIPGKGISTAAAANTSIAESSVSVPSGEWLKGQDPNQDRWWFKKADGSYPANGWYWLDGNRDGIAECYYFDNDGWMHAGGKTPDGYTVDANGAWTENGVVQTRRVSSAPGGTSVSRTGSSSGGSGGGGGGGGSSSGSSSGRSSSGGSSGGSSFGSTAPVMYTYKVEYVDESGNVLSEMTGSAKKNTAVDIPVKNIDGYILNSGEGGMRPLTEDGQVFIVRYTKQASGTGSDDTNPGGGSGSGDNGNTGGDNTGGNTGGDNTGGDNTGENTGGDNTGGGNTGGGTGDNTQGGDTPSGNEDPQEETLSYVIRYLDENGDIVKSVDGTGTRGESVTAEQELDGYTPQANVFTFVLSEEGQVIELHYTKNKAVYRYTVRYVDENGTVLASVSGSCEDGDTINIEPKTFDSYELDGECPDSAVITEDTTITITYKQTQQDDPVPQEEPVSYSIRYIDKDSDALILEEEGQGKHGDRITPSQEIMDYAYAAEYSFTLDKDGSNVFAVYVVSTKQEALVETKYTVVCVDEDGTAIKTYTGTVLCGEEPVELTDNFVVDGYTRTDSECFYVRQYKNNTFTATFTKDKQELTYIVELVDIDTGTTLDTHEYSGLIGDTIDLTTIPFGGYTLVSGQSEEGKITGNAANNKIRLFYRKDVTKPQEVITADYTVRFRNEADKTQFVLNDEHGTGEVGEITYYFEKRFNDAQGNTWEAINDVPVKFTLTDRGNNVFIIEYRNIGNVNYEKQEATYSIRYIAEDSGGVLGLMTGRALEGTSVSLRNSWTPDYTFADDSMTSIKLSADSDENVVDVPMRRVTTREHGYDELTGKYKVREWSAIFIDSEGNYLMPARNGYSVEGDRFYLDYPSVIIDGDITYRAKTTGPIIENVTGTATKHYTIRYITGQSSENKLTEWENRAHQKANEIFGTEPASYFVTYKEKNLDNDIGVEFGVGNLGDEIQINARTFNGWEEPTSNLGTFVLDEDNKAASTQYEFQPYTDTNGKVIDQTLKNIERTYTVYIKDTDGNDIAGPTTGHMWFESNKQQRSFQVYFPEMFTDANGDLWATDEVSPKTAVFDTLSDTDVTVVYHKRAENNGLEYTVTNNAETNQILNNLVTRLGDSDSHDAYIIGKNYNPLTSEISATSLNSRMADCGGEVVDTFKIDGDTYTVVHFTFSKYWDQDNCTHSWHYEYEEDSTCLSNGEAKAVCDRCGKTVTVLKPAVGHVDGNHDSICDVCGTELRRQLGDIFPVTWTTGVLSDQVGFESKEYRFVCIDEDYNGTGSMLYIMEEGLGSDVYGQYSENGETKFDDSLLKYFLADEFADGLSVSDKLQLVNGQKVSVLTKEEYDSYYAGKDNHYSFPGDTSILYANESEGVMLSDGTLASPDEAADYTVHPVILVKASSEEEGGVRDNWHVGDLQLRTIGDKEYLFRCVDENYKDSTYTDKAQALFLCETVIPSSALLGFTGPNDTQETRYFGENNNYRYSNIKAFLEENTNDESAMAKIDIGISKEYSGSTQKMKFDNYKASDLTPHKRSTAQKLYARIFIPSVEEAMAMKDYLWKFNGSSVNNPEDIITPYIRSYWLRTPEYGTTDRIYSVNLETGQIEPKYVNGSEDEVYCITGIRPMYVLEQNREDSATSGR